MAKATDTKIVPNRKPPNAGMGRPKGAVNKTTAAAKEAIQTVFDNLGGPDALERWVRSDADNEKAFYVQVWPKLLPLQVNGAGEGGEHIHAIKWID
ncbi:MAG: hypothetical protein ACRCYS_10940 [Beijerinckiaceae bacterium]